MKHGKSKAKVHLVVYRDPDSGAQELRLRAPLFQEAWQNELVAAAANTARGMLQDRPSLERVVALARNAMAAASRVADGLLAQAPAGSVACQAGCDHCCHQSVGVTLPEALAVFDHLQRTRSGAELAELAQRVAQLDERTRGLSSNERFSPDHPCPLLEAGKCSAYEARPLACRGMNSLDAQECSTRLREPDARAAFLSTGEGSHSYMEPIRAFHAISAGLQLSLTELYRLDMRPLELTAVLQQLLNGPAASLEQWLSGRRPFESAVTDEAAGEPGLRQLSGVLPQR